MKLFIAACRGIGKVGVEDNDGTERFPSVSKPV